MTERLDSTDASGNEHLYRRRAANVMTVERNYISLEPHTLPDAIPEQGRPSLLIMLATSFGPGSNEGNKF